MKKLAYGIVLAFAAMSAASVWAAGTSSYVQDGLIACWDGIENAGAGVHDGSATVWKDVKGGYEFSLTGVTVNDDRMTFAGSSSSYGVLTSADTISTFVAAKDGTMEIVYRSNTGSGSQVFLQAPATSGIACGIWYYSNASLMMYFSSVSQNNNSGFNFTSGSTTNSVSVRYTSCVPVSSFANGVERSASSTAKSYWTYPNDDDKAYVGNRANKSGNFVGSIYCIRIYNRQLSDAEIAANYKVDQKRFFFQLDESTLYVSSLSEDVGSPSPAYGPLHGLAAGETVPVSCGDAVLTNSCGIVYSCAGWKLYDFDGNMVSNGTETSFAYKHPLPATARELEWQWEKRLVPTNALPVGGAAFHVDASLLSTMTTVAAANGRQLVTEWRDADGGAMKAVAGTGSRPWIGTTNGLPYVDFGAQKSGSPPTSSDESGYLAWSSSLSTIREVFLVFSDYPGSKHSFFLGAGNSYHFHRNQKKLFDSQYASTYVQNGLIEVDGVERAISYELPEGFHLIHLRTTGNVTASNFARDRANINYGGQRLREVAVYTKTLADEEAEAVYDYMYNKWFDTQDVLVVDASPEQLGSPLPGYGILVGLMAGDTRVVSCGEPAVTNSAGVSYVCVGWKLYDKDDNVISSGEGTSFTYEHPTPAEYRRLEWQWVEPLTILPIPDQVTGSFAPCRPEFVVSNRLTSATWNIGGDISSPYFDVEYTGNDAAGTANVVAIGKGQVAGLSASGSFNITVTKREDENFSSTDTSARRVEVNGKYVYVFTNAASAQVSMVKRPLLLTDYLVVGGGGGGGNTSGGGGGGGGVTNATGLVGKCLAGNDIFTVSVGAGGAGASGYNGKGANGKATTLRIGDVSVSIAGGGGGGSWFTAAGAAGASGGGGTKGGAGGAGTEGIGHDGATAGSLSRSGGGGGAGHAGYQYTESTKLAGNGGEGIVSSITGEAVYYGGGGGGGGSGGGNDNFDPGFGGLGGGGDGEKRIPGHPGADGFGGGGGGGGWANNQQQRGGNGGSGTVILAFKPSDFNIDTIPPQTLVAGGARPEPVVRLAGDSTVLTKDVHYEVTYTDNDDLGTALMTVTGIGTYAGKVGYATFLVVERYYAKPSVDVEGDGLSWATAMSVANFFATHGVVDRPCEVWIAAGTVSAQAFSITNNASLVIRGGFAGTETSLDERAEGALTVFDGESTSSILLTIDNATDDDIFLDRIKFCRARSNGFVKTGKGGLKAYNCAFETNGRNVSEVYGRGMNAQSDGYGSLVVSNCVFAGNRSVNSDKQWGGFGLYVKNFNDALVDDSLFVTNGYDLTKTPGSTYVGYLNARGSALLVDSTPITIRNSRFAGNCCPVRKKDDTYWCGGTIALNGACGGSVIDHCALIGNTELYSNGDEGSNSGGAIAIRLNASAAKVAVRNCTIAYNLTQSPYSSGGITVYKGSADISNTVLWKNLRYHTTSPGYGRDLHVASSYASATIRNSTVTSLDPGDECVVGATMDEESVFALDPKLVTSTAVFESLLTQNATGPYFKPTTANPTVYEDLAGMDAHLLSPAGYFVNGGAAGPATTDYSPAIDLGDPAADYSNEPAPNGARLNAGAFGNTAEASSTAYGQPEANIEVTFPDGMTRPKVTITMGLESGDAYSAVVQLYCTTGGVLLSSQTWSGVVNGDELELFLPYYLANGDDFRVLVMINAPDASPVECQASETVDGNYPPFYGKGGGPNVIHVRPGADCLQDGTSWTDAFTNIPDAMKAAAADPSKTEMWIAGPIVASTQPASVTLSATSFRIRGGFAGVENDESERVAGAVTTLDGSNSYRAFNFANATPVFFERLLFTHGSKTSSGGQIYKSGAGDVTFADCIFKDNLWTGFPLNGLACYFTGSSSATVSITNCLFDSNRVKDLGSNGSGHGRVIYAESLRRLAIDGCTFVSNGCDLAAGVGFNSAGRDRCNGSVICANGAPVTARNCEFRANRGVIRTDTGGIIRLGGASHPSAFTNCLFIGNADTYGESLADGNNKYPYGGTLLVCYDNAAGVCDLDQCTFAYNISDAKKCCAGIQVVKGRLHAHNTIIYGNKAGPDSEAPGDMLLWNDGTATLDYVRLTGEGTYGETDSSVISTNAHTRYTMNNVTFGDPSFATTYDSFTNNIVTASTTNYRYHYFKNTVAGSDALLAFDAHLRSKVGMYNNAGEFVKVRGEMSDAIDGGERHSPYRNEPEPNGHRANLGAYGNTRWASMTQPIGSVYYIR